MRCRARAAEATFLRYGLLPGFTAVGRVQATYLGDRDVQLVETCARETNASARVGPYRLDRVQRRGAPLSLAALSVRIDGRLAGLVAEAPLEAGQVDFAGLRRTK